MMEILDNSQHFNHLEEQTKSHYNHRLPSDLPFAMKPMGSTLRRSRVEDNDVGFLLSCKRELSTEVIRWKEENLSLQKVNESHLKKLDELHQIVEKLTKKNSELEARLLVADDENEQLRMHSLAVDEENTILFRKLSQGLNKYHSFPWSDLPHSSPLHANVVKEVQKVKTPPPEDWKEVSERLFEQMKREMKELQEMSGCLSGENDKSPDVKYPNSDVVKIEEGVSNLLTKTKSLKQHLLHQRQSLELMINSVEKGQIKRLDSSNLDTDDRKQGSHDTKVNSKFSTRPSDENFRDYFTRQLQGKRSVEDMTAMMQLYLEAKEKDDSKNPTLGCKKSPNAVIFQNRSDSSQNKDVPTAQNFAKEITVKRSALPTSDEDRVCPICEAVFPKIIPQKDFEAHVVEHLEVESASLLDQYVVL